LVLSPSAIALYLKCPRWFFYQNLLKLDAGEESAAATFGKLVHHLLEQSEDYDHLKDLLEKEEIQDLTPLQQAQLKIRLEKTFEALNQSGYFEKSYIFLYKEIKLGPCMIEDMQLSGRTDLIREHADRHLEIVDYKTSKNQYLSHSPDTNRSGILKALSPIDWDIPEPDRYDKREYQLPFYWLMAQSQFLDRRIDVTIQVVRESGCSSFTVTHDELEAGKPYLLELIRHVSESLYSTSHFEPLGRPEIDCRMCAYATICEGAS